VKEQARQNDYTITDLGFVKSQNIYFCKAPVSNGNNARKRKRWFPKGIN
jgi:hypothetical protein